MFIAPLNYDRFFKKVFSDLTIAQKFLEDVFCLEIQEITRLPEKNRVTNDASIVEFDFRCKIDGHYVIIDMQQWHKTDVAHRFFIYHAISSALQLESLPLKSIFIDKKTGLKKEVKDYRRIEPVITLVWMVHDCFSLENDFLSYIMTPEDVVKFIANDTGLWSCSNIKKILDERQKAVKLLRIKESKIDFIPKNKLVFAFQKNIVKNKNHQKYFNWFKFAEVSGYDNNTEEHFKEIKADKDFKKVYLSIKKRLGTNGLSQEEKEYLTTETEEQEKIMRFIEGVEDDGRLKERIKAEKIIEEKNKVIVEKDKAIVEKDKAIVEKNEKLKIALKTLMELGLTEVVARQKLEI